MNYALAFSLTLGVLCWLLRKPKQITHAELLAEMRRRKIGTK